VGLEASTQAAWRSICKKEAAQKGRWQKPRKDSEHGETEEIAKLSLASGPDWESTTNQLGGGLVNGLSRNCNKNQRGTRRRLERARKKGE